MLIITLLVLGETNGNCINMNEFYIYIYVKQYIMCWAVGWLGKSHMKKVFCFVFIKAVKVHHFHSAWHLHWTSIHVVLLVHEPIWLSHNSSVSVIFIYIIIVHPCTIRYFLYLFLSTALWIFSNPCSPCVFWLSSLLLYMALFEYGCGFFQMWSRMASCVSVFVCFLAWQCMYSSVVKVLASCVVCCMWLFCL